MTYSAKATADTIGMDFQQELSAYLNAIASNSTVRKSFCR
jgi:hypothetical protein